MFTFHITNNNLYFHALLLWTNLNVFVFRQAIIYIYIYEYQLVTNVKPSFSTKNFSFQLGHFGINLNKQ